MKILLFAITVLISGCFERAESSEFKVHESFLFSNRPELDIKRLPTVGHQHIYWDEHADIRADFPSEEATREVAAKLPSSLEQDIYFIDIEQLPVHTHDKRIDWAESKDKISSILTWVRSERPTLKIGLYMVMPSRAYWAHDRNDKWRERNDYFKSLASYVDFVSPSLYTFYEDKAGWVEYAIDNINEAKKYGKPVYPFIWPQYHDSSALALQLIPGDYWRLQLETIKAYADGLIIWGGWQMEWSEATSETDPNNWWFQTIEFNKLL